MEEGISADLAAVVAVREALTGTGGVLARVTLRVVRMASDLVCFSRLSEALRRRGWRAIVQTPMKREQAVRDAC